jgi:hypothetical protein
MIEFGGGTRWEKRGVAARKEAAGTACECRAGPASECLLSAMSGARNETNVRWFLNTTAKQRFIPVVLFDV